MKFHILVLLLTVFALSACISGRPKTESYTDSNGVTTAIQSDKDVCKQSCNDDYSRCSETDGAKDNSGVQGARGFFGASAECRSTLKSCLGSCKGL